MRPLIARSLLVLSGAVGTGTVVATKEIYVDKEMVIASHIVEYVDGACLVSGDANRDTVALFHTASGVKKTTQAQKRASARLDSLFAYKCVLHELRVDTTFKETLPDTVAEPDTSVQPDTLPTPPEEPDTVEVPPPLPDSTPVDTSAKLLALIGPTRSPAEAGLLGGGYGLMDPLFAKWEPLRFSVEGTAWTGNYYDRGLVYEEMCIRHRNPVWCQRGHAMVVDYRRNYLHKNNYQTSPHWAQLEGLALHFWQTGDDSSRIAVGKAAWNLAASITWARDGNYTDARQQARALVGALLAWQLNAPNAPTGGWAATLDKGLDAILPQQSTDGGWRYPVNTCDASLNYMGAMLADALIRVYEVYRADPRIPAAVSKTANFLWTQWRPNDAIPSFNYYERVCSNQHGTGGPTATPDLTGLYAPLYAWMSRQDPTYRPMADAVFSSAMYGLYPQGSKQFNQAFYSTWRALGYLE